MEESAVTAPKVRDYILISAISHILVLLGVCSHFGLPKYLSEKYHVIKERAQRTLFERPDKGFTALLKKTPNSARHHSPANKGCYISL